MQIGSKVKYGETLTEAGREELALPPIKIEPRYGN
jgi:hypothetical protein